MEKYKIFISCDPAEAIIIEADEYKIHGDKIAFVSDAIMKALFNLNYITGFTEVENKSEN